MVSIPCASCLSCLLSARTRLVASWSIFAYLLSIELLGDKNLDFNLNLDFEDVFVLKIEILILTNTNYPCVIHPVSVLVTKEAASLGGISQTKCGDLLQTCLFTRKCEKCQSIYLQFCCGQGNRKQKSACRISNEEINYTVYNSPLKHLFLTP